MKMKEFGASLAPPLDPPLLPFKEETILSCVDYFYALTKILVQDIRLQVQVSFCVFFSGGAWHVINRNSTCVQGSKQ